MTQQAETIPGWGGPWTEKTDWSDDRPPIDDTQDYDRQEEQITDPRARVIVRNMNMISMSHMTVETKKRLIQQEQERLFDIGYEAVLNVPAESDQFMHWTCELRDRSKDRAPSDDEQHIPTLDEIQRAAGSAGDWWRKIHIGRSRTERSRHNAHRKVNQLQRATMRDNNDFGILVIPQNNVTQSQREALRNNLSSQV